MHSRIIDFGLIGFDKRDGDACLMHPPQWLYKNGKKSFWSISFVPYKGAFGIANVLFPLYVAFIGGSLADIGLVVAAFNLASIPGLILWGKLSDKSARRRIFIFFGFLTSTIIFGMTAFASTAGVLILINILLGLLSTSCIPASSMLVIELTPKPLWEKKIGSFNFVSGVGWTAGLFIASIFLIRLGLLYLFVLCALFCGISSILAVFLLEEPPITFERHVLAFLIPRPGIREKLAFAPTLLFQLPRFFQYKFWRRLKYELTNALPLYYVATFIVFTAFFVAFLPFPLYLKTLGINDSLIFFIYVLNSIMSTVTHAITGKLAETLGRKKIFTTAISLRIFIFSFFAIFVLLFPQWAIFFVTLLFLIAGITWGIIAVSGSALLTNIAPPERQGNAFGMYNATISLATTIGSLLGGFLAFYVGFFLAFYIAAFIVGIGTAIIIKIKF